MAFRLRHVAHLPTMPPLSLVSSGLVVLPSLPCGAEEVGQNIAWLVVSITSSELT